VVGVSNLSLKPMPYRLELAVDAVYCEPLSGQKSLLTGKITGNLADSGQSVRWEAQKAPRFQLVARKFPTQVNRELIRPNRDEIRSIRDFNSAVGVGAGSKVHRHKSKGTGGCN
jgi:hypothetical protein